MKLTWLACLASIILSAPGLVLSADPSPKGNFEPLKQHGTAPEANELWTRAVEAERAVRQHVEKFAKARLIEPKQLSEALLKHDDMRSTDMRLQPLGESLPIDFEMRRRFYEERLVAAHNAWLGQPNSPPVRQKAIQQLTKSQEKRKQSYIAILSRLENGDGPGAEKALDTARNELYQLANILSIEERKPFVEPFEHVRGQVDSAMRVYRAQAAIQAFEEKIALADQENKGIFQKLDTALAALEQSGACRVDDKSLTAAEFVGFLVEQWNKAHCRIQMGAALKRIQDRSASATSYSISSGSSTNDLWAANAEQLSVACQERIKKLISVVTKISTNDKAKDQYLSLVQALANVDCRIGEDIWTDATQQSLLELARKGGINQIVESYDSATSELLRWKEAFTTAQAEGIKSHVSLTGYAREKLTIGPQQKVGMYTMQQDEPGRPRILVPIPDLVPAIAKAFSEARVVAKQVRPLDGSTPTWMTQFDAGIYCIVSGDVVMESQVEQLRKELLIDDQHPPLTLKAATAIHTASRGIYVATGCTVQDFVIEPAPTRFALLKESASPLIPYGQVHPQGPQGELTFILVRFVTKPDWMQHRYFIAPVAPKG